MAPANEDQWRSAELGIIGGVAHALNGALTGLSLATELARMDEELPERVLRILEEQAARIEGEIGLLFALRDLERTDLELQDPADLAHRATALFRRMPISDRATLRVLIAPDAPAVEVAAGPCIRAIVLSLESFVSAAPPEGPLVLELRLDHASDGVFLHARCTSSDLAPDSPLLAAAAALLREEHGARLLTLPHPTVALSLAGD